MRILANFSKGITGTFCHGHHQYTSLVQVLQSKRLFNNVNINGPRELTTLKCKENSWNETPNKYLGIRTHMQDVGGVTKAISMSISPRELAKKTANMITPKLPTKENGNHSRDMILKSLEMSKEHIQALTNSNNNIILLEIETVELNGFLQKYHKYYAVLHFKSGDRNLSHFEDEIMVKTLFGAFGRHYEQQHARYLDMKNHDNTNHYNLNFSRGRNLLPIGNWKIHIFAWNHNRSFEILTKSLKPSRHSKINSNFLQNCIPFGYRTDGMSNNKAGPGVTFRKYSTDSSSNKFAPQRHIPNDVTKSKMVYYNSPFVLELLGGHKYPLSHDTYPKAVEEANRRRAALKFAHSKNNILAKKESDITSNIDPSKPVNLLGDKGNNTTNPPTSPSKIRDKGKHPRKQAPTGCVSPKCKKEDPCSNLGPNKNKKVADKGNILGTDSTHPLASLGFRNVPLNLSSNKTGSGLCNGCTSFSGKDKNKPGSNPPKPGNCSKDKGKSKKPGSCSEDDKPYQPKCNKNPCDGDGGTKPQSPCAKKKEDPKKGPCGTEKKLDGSSKQLNKGPPKPSGQNEKGQTGQSCAQKKDSPCSKKPSPCDKKDKSKNDPCAKKKDPCAKKDPCSKKKDPCAKKKDPCSKKLSPCGKKDKGNPCTKKEKDTCSKKPSPCAKKDKPKAKPCGTKDKAKPCGAKDKPKSEKPCAGPCNKNPQSPCGKKDKPKSDPCAKKPPNPCDKKIRPQTETNQFPCTRQKEKKKGNTCGKEKKSKSPCTGPCAEKKKPSNPCKKNNPCNKKSSPCGKKSDPCAKKSTSNSGCSQNQHPCGKKPRDTKPKCKPKGDQNKKCYSTVAGNVITPSPSTLNRNFHCFSFTRRYSDSKSKKGAGDSKCKLIQTKMPAHRQMEKYHQRQRPKDGLRSCYPAYDMDCPKKLCKDPRKTACSRFNHLKGEHKNSGGKK
ncbi:uncharacterized protein LOC101893366 isoform X2 [Musca domestica]|uniref:Uncharacterized protein LOC101893366 isoform X2 n=1 Tax=Musca domestica TaxID=7370 RepID=A0A9J7DHV2_MUSDO|nr:uncharacterized protein LOC101893366 isoform X2 [Musca domestica]